MLPLLTCSFIYIYKFFLIYRTGNFQPPWFIPDFLILGIFIIYNIVLILGVNIMI